jgi:hypothetical protein
MSKVILRKYGEAATFNFDLFEIDGIDFKIDAVHASGDTKLMKNEGAETNTTNGFTDEGQGYSIVLTATEMEHARGKIYIVDQGTKAWLDTGITIETYGHASAQHPFFGEGVWDETLTGANHNFPTSAGRRLRAIGDVVSGSVNDAAATTTSFITDLTGTQTDHYSDQTLLWTSGNLAGMSRSVLSYNESTKLVTIEEALPEAPANGDDFDINPVHIHPVSQIAFEIWEELLTSGTHNTSNSAGKRLRELKELSGYEGGFIYYDSVDGQAGDEAYINGTLSNPVNNETDLLTLKAALNIGSVKIHPGSTLTLTTSHEKQEYIGESWTLNLGGQSISGSFFHGATSVNGIATGSIPPKFEDCIIKDVTVPPSRFYVCGYSGTMIAGSAGDYFFISDSHSGIAGVSTPSFDYGAAIGATNFNFRGYHGGQNIENMKAGDNLSFDGDGQITIAASSVGGVMRIAGHQRMTGAAAFIAAGGTIVDDARFAMDQIIDNVVGQDGDTLESLSDQIDGISTGGINVVSALDGTVQAKYASDGGTVEVVRGDTVSIPYDLTVDLTAKKLYFAAKKQAGDPVYMIDVTDITSSVTDAAEGQGVIPLTSAMLTGLPPQTYDAEMEMRDGDGISIPITVLKFKLKVVEQVIVFSSSSSSSNSSSSSSSSSA